MRTALAPLAALALAACGQPKTAAENSRPARDWCDEFYATFNISDHIDERTGRLRRSSLTPREEECVRRKSEEAIRRFEGNGT